jgi:hypothetical protein
MSILRNILKVVFFYGWMRLAGLLVAFFLFSIPAKGQFMNYGTEPSRIKWKTYQTPHFKLIYPGSNDSVAYRYALFLEHTYPHIGKTIGESRIRSFPVILHPGNMLSNGMVVWAPRRMELVTTPSANLSAQSWDKHLVLHESRHVLQMYKLSQGLFKPLSYILGEQTSGVASVLVPKWFFEGDAVVTETAMSNSGRGRLPEFNMIYRAQMLSGNFYSYDKWALGSYKNYTGDYYALGYNLTSFARYKYGEDIWDKVTSRYTRRFFQIPPFSRALKHYTGLNTKALFNDTYHFLNEEWTDRDRIYQQSGFGDVINYITPQTKRYVSYNYPQVLNDSSIIAVKTSLDNINSLILIKDGKEKRLCYLGSISGRIILNHNRVYWTEYVPGIRWTHENYSGLKYYDLATGKIITVTSNQRFLAPSINDTGNIAAMSQPSVSGTNRIVLIDIEDRKEIRSFDVPSNGFVKEMVFVDDDRIAAIVIDDEGLSIMQFSLSSGQWQRLVGPTSANITSLTELDGRLFFESGLNGTNNIYSFDFLTSESTRLTTSRFGAFSPAFSGDGKRLFFSDYSANGYRLASVSVDHLQGQPADFGQVQDFTLAESIAKQEHFNLDTVSLGSMDFNPKPYRKGTHLFHAHSWAPFYYDATNISAQSDDLSTIVKPGCMLLSQNMLSTMVTQVGWYYDDGYNYGKLALTYRGWYPVIDLSLEYGGRAFDYRWQKNEEGEDLLFYYPTKHNLIDMETRLYIPFNLSRNHYISGFRPSLTYSYTNNQYQQLGSRQFHDYQYLLSELTYYRYRKLAYRDILPRLGYQIQLQYLNIPFDTENFGSLYAAKVITYLPGLIRGHGLMLRAMYQYQDVDGKTLYIPQKLISQPRGYSYIYQTRQQVDLKADYSFSLFYPDWSIGGLAYIKRIRSNVFYDLSRNQRNKQSGWTTQSSYGADLIFDCNLFRISYPMSLGLRVVNPIDYGNIQAEALFSVSF